MSTKASMKIEPYEGEVRVRLVGHSQYWRVEKMANEALEGMGGRILGVTYQHELGRHFIMILYSYKEGDVPIK